MNTLTYEQMWKCNGSTATLLFFLNGLRNVGKMYLKCPYLI